MLDSPWRAEVVPSDGQVAHGLTFIELMELCFYFSRLSDSEAESFIDDIIELRGLGASLVEKLEEQIPTPALGPQLKAKDCS